MLAVAGLLVAAIAPASCPSDKYVGTTYSSCVHDALPSLPSPMSQEFVCSARTEDFQCCRATTASSIVESRCTANFETAGTAFQCNPTLYSYEEGTFNYWSMRCPPPPPAEPTTSGEDLDGATVGTIVVASLIGVALVGGAIAVYLEV